MLFFCFSGVAACQCIIMNFRLPSCLIAPQLNQFQDFGGVTYKSARRPATRLVSAVTVPQHVAKFNAVNLQSEI